jgi:hypothetical protein
MFSTHTRLTCAAILLAVVVPARISLDGNKLLVNPMPSTNTSIERKRWILSGSGL